MEEPEKSKLTGGVKISVIPSVISSSLKTSQSLNDPNLPALSKAEGFRDLEKAAAIINAGGVVVFPTDTVYGIGCRFDNRKALERIRRIKGTPENQQFPVLVSDVGQVKKIAKLTNPAQKLIDKYWPGALTIVLDSRHPELLPRHPELATGPELYRRDSGSKHKIGFRMPDSLLTRTLIEKVGAPIIGTSANFHTKRTSAGYGDLDPQFIKLADYVIPGECKLGRESTVVDATVDPPKVLREGAVSI